MITSVFAIKKDKPDSYSEKDEQELGI